MRSLHRHLAAELLIVGARACFAITEAFDVLHAIGERSGPQLLRAAIRLRGIAIDIDVRTPCSSCNTTLPRVLLDRRNRCLGCSTSTSI